MVNTFLKIRYLISQAIYQPLGNLAQKNATLRTRIKELGIGAAE